MEKSTYEVDLDRPNQDDQKAKAKKGIRQAPNYPKAKTKDYAIKRGVLRGAYGGFSDEVGANVEVRVDISSIDEGIYGFVQSTTCRRRVLTEIYGNDKASEY